MPPNNVLGVERWQKSSPAASEGLATVGARPSGAAGLELCSNQSQKSGNSHNFIPGFLQISKLEKGNVEKALVCHVT